MSTKGTRAKDASSNEKSVRPPQQEKPAFKTADDFLIVQTETAISNPGQALPSQILALQHKAGNQAVQRLLTQHMVQAKLAAGPADDSYEQEADQVATPVDSSAGFQADLGNLLGTERQVQRVFDANTPTTYDDDGGHGLAQHGAGLDVAHHEARAKINTPTYSSSGWASDAMMKTAVTKALKTHTGADVKKSATKWKKKWTVNVSLAKCGYTWTYDATSGKVTKKEVDTAVVIFSVGETTGNILYMVTAFPGGPAKDFNATA